MPEQSVPTLKRRSLGLSEKKFICEVTYSALFLYNSLCQDETKDSACEHAVLRLSK